MTQNIDQQLKRISSLVSTQFPAHFREKESLLISFAEAYYEWCELEGNVNYDTDKLSSFLDVDTTDIDKFGSYFCDTFLPSIPREVFADKKLLLKNARQFYESRGTLKSYEFLFRLLFNELVEISYPRDTLFVPSDADWKRDRSVFVKSELSLSGVNAQTILLNTQSRKISAQLKYAVYVAPGVYEVFFDTKRYYDEQILSVKILDTTYEIHTVFGNINITSTGRGFTVGQIYTITSPLGSDTQVRVEKIGPQGQIKRLSIIKFGYGYDPKTTYSLIPVDNGINPGSATITGPGGVVPSKNGTETNNIGDEGVIVRNDYIGTGYFADDTYAGTLLTRFSGRTFEDTDELARAQIVVTAGSAASYIGYHTSIKGMPSELSRLLDSNLNQEFSYVIQSNKNFESYSSIVDEVVHPAGLKFFGERRIRNSIAVQVIINNVLSILSINKLSIVDTADALFFAIFKTLEDTATTGEILAKSFGKILSDETGETTDSQAKLVTKVLSDIATMQDDEPTKSFTKVLLDEAITAELLTLAFSKSLADSVASTDQSVLAFTKVLSDDTTHSEVQVLNFFKVLADIAATSDQIAFDASKVLSDSASTSDSPALTTGKALSDSTGTTTDATTVNLTKVIQDSIATMDMILIAVNYYLDDSVDADDSVSLMPTKPFTEELVASDTQTKTIGKNFEEEVFAEDMGGLALDPVYVGSPSDGNEVQQRYWEYTYLEGEQVFT